MVNDCISLEVDGHCASPFGQGIPKQTTLSHICCFVTTAQKRICFCSVLSRSRLIDPPRNNSIFSRSILFPALRNSSEWLRNVVMIRFQKLQGGAGGRCGWRSRGYHLARHDAGEISGGFGLIGEMFWSLKDATMSDTNLANGDCYDQIERVFMETHFFARRSFVMLSCTLRSSCVLGERVVVPEATLLT